MQSGVARLPGTSVLAASTATADVPFRTAAGPAPEDADLIRAARHTATTPEGALGPPRVGRVEPGCRADLVVLDPRSYAVRFVLRAGAVVAETGTQWPS